MRDMRILEENSAFLGISNLLLMENAGKAVADFVSKLMGSSTKGKRILVVAGLGNNGGDGFVAARHLAIKSFDVTVILAGKPGEIRTYEAQTNFYILRNMEHTVRIKVLSNIGDIEVLEKEVEEADVIVDSLLGIGIKGRVREPYATIIEIINRAKAIKVAVDVPSGLNADTGEPCGVAVKADYTITFHKLKRGLADNPYAGRVIVADIGIPKEAEIIVGPGDLRCCLKKRAPESKKGDYGRILVIGGSRDFSGAPALTALAALRMGADIVILYVPEVISTAVRAFSPNLIVNTYCGDYFNEKAAKNALNIAEKCDVIALGPGLGLREEVREAVISFISRLEKPLVIDADGLKSLRGKLSVLRDKSVVLTPHAGEYKIIFGEEPPKDCTERIRAVKEKAKEVGVTILLKGPRDVISDGLRVKINHTGNASMTVGGTGDVLTGVVATFLAWGNEPFEAACAGAFLNGLLGDYVASTKGAHILATDLIDAIPSVTSKILEEVEVGERSINFLKNIGLI